MTWCNLRSHFSIMFFSPVLRRVVRNENGRRTPLTSPRESRFCYLSIDVWEMGVSSGVNVQCESVPNCGRDSSRFLSRLGKTISEDNSETYFCPWRRQSIETTSQRQQSTHMIGIMRSCSRSVLDCPHLSHLPISRVCDWPNRSRPRHQ
jgi:hypothetical protein